MRVSGHALPLPMLLQHPFDHHSADTNRLIMVITHAHARTGRARRIHSIYFGGNERLLRPLYQYLQF